MRKDVTAGRPAHDVAPYVRQWIGRAWPDALMVNELSPARWLSFEVHLRSGVTFRVRVSPLLQYFPTRLRAVLLAAGERECRSLESWGGGVMLLTEDGAEVFPDL